MSRRLIAVLGTLSVLAAFGLVACGDEETGPRQAVDVTQSRPTRVPTTAPLPGGGGGGPGGGGGGPGGGGGAEQQPSGDGNSGSGGDGGGDTTSTEAPSSSEPTSPDETTTTSTEPPAVTTTSAPPPSTVAAGTVVSSSGAYLADDGENDFTFNPSGDCALLVKPAWQLVECLEVAMAGGAVTYVVEKKGEGDATAWATRLYEPSAGSGEWAVTLHVLDETGGIFSGMGVLTADLDGDGKPELVVGYRLANTDAELAYDIVTNPDSQPLAAAAHRGGLQVGVVSVSAGKVEDYTPDGQGGFVRTTVAFSGGQFTVTASDIVSTAPSSSF